MKKCTNCFKELLENQGEVMINRDRETDPPRSVGASKIIDCHECKKVNVISS